VRPFGDKIIDGLLRRPAGGRKKPETGLQPKVRGF